MLSLPDVPVVVYEDTPLVLTLCQVRFPTVLAVADETVAARFQRAIQSDYPIALPAGQLQVDIPLGVGRAQVQQGRLWHFADPADTWTIVLAQDFVTLETRAYSTFAEFLGRLKAVLAALAEHVAPSMVTRIGLRYVNEIRPGHRDWSKVIRRELLGPQVEAAFIGHVEQSVQQLALRYPDGQGINVRHGAFPTSTTVQPRAGQEAPSEPFYLLDFDAFREFPPSAAVNPNPEAIAEHVEDFNQAIYRLFRWSITEDYLSTLEVRRHAGG